MNEVRGGISGVLQFWLDKSTALLSLIQGELKIGSAVRGRARGQRVEDVQCAKSKRGDNVRGVSGEKRAMGQRERTCTGPAV